METQLINRLKPYGVMVIVIWPCLTVLLAYLFAMQSTEAQGKILADKKISAVVTKVTESHSKRKGPSYWVNYKIPTSSGDRVGGGPISQSTYQAVMNGSTNNVDVYVASDGTSWTAYGRDIHADDSYGKNWFIGAMVGFCCAPLLYFFLVAIIPFGRTWRSLNQRWGPKI
jgi:hypothetical protein